MTSYLQSVQVGQQRQIVSQQGRGIGLPTREACLVRPTPQVQPTPGRARRGSRRGIASFGIALPELGGPLQVTGAIAPTRIINLLRVPGSQQVMLKVRVAELNRTALRLIGCNFLGVDPKTGTIVGSQISSSVTAAGQVGVNPPLGSHLFGSAISGVGALTGQKWHDSLRDLPGRKLHVHFGRLA